MNNGNETLGLSVISTTPEAHQTNINVNSQIEITFSGDINRSTLNNSIIVFEDYAGVYNGLSSLKSSDKFNIVKGTVTYADRVLKFTPKEQLNIDTRYIVVLNNTLQDITGNLLLNKFVFAFNTEITKSYAKCEIIYPTFGLISNVIPTIQWNSQNAPSYILQISKSNKFESLLFETFVVDDDAETIVEFKPDIPYKEGVYYVRVKSEGGEWSEPCQFFIKEVTDAVVAADDQSEELYLDDFLAGLEEELEILEFFPKEDSINNSLKTNIFYIKIKGEVQESRLSLLDFEVTGTAFDEEDDSTYEHGTLDGSWSIVYDAIYNCTYLIFTPSVTDTTTGTTDNTDTTTTP
jgi:hypothetical protein